MLQIIVLTLKGIFRDRIFHGIAALAVIFAFIPFVSSLSMRQVTELSITLSLSLISFILFLLAVFLGGTTVWRDIERRYAISVLGLPLDKGGYILGKFLGVSSFLLLVAAILGAMAYTAIFVSAGVYPSDRPFSPSNILLAIVFDVLKYVLLTAFSFLFSSISTSFFLPVFGTLSIFFVGSTIQEAFDFIRGPSAQNVPLFVRQCVEFFYYVLPNFSAFDLKTNAIYAIELSSRGVVLTAAYFCFYVIILCLLTSFIFSRREIK